MMSIQSTVVISEEDSYLSSVARSLKERPRYRLEDVLGTKKYFWYISSSVIIRTSVVVNTTYEKIKDTDSRLAENMLNEIEKFIEYARRTCVLVDDEVKGYLLKYRELIPAVEKAIRTAKEKLSAAQLLLKVYHDFEIAEETLHLIARFEQYDEIVLRRIRDVRKDYWDLLPDDSGVFILMTDYRTPSK